MSSDVVFQGIGSSYVIEGTDTARVRLLGTSNLISGNSVFDVDATGWSGDATLTRPYYAESPWSTSRALAIQDDDGAVKEYATVELDADEIAEGTVVSVSMWALASAAFQTIKLVIRDGDDVDRTTASPMQSVTTIMPAEWVFLYWTVTLSDPAWTSVTTVNFDIEPAAATAGATGSLTIFRPRVHTVSDTLTSFPEWPMRPFSTIPYALSSTDRNLVGEYVGLEGGHVPTLRFPTAFANADHQADILATLNHGGPMLVEPWVDQATAWIMRRGAQGWGLNLIRQKAIGYEGEWQLIGQEPLWSIPGYGVGYVRAS